MIDVMLNEEQKLYVIPAGNGYSSLGFDVCKARTIAYAQWAVIALPEPLPYASLEAYELYRDTVDQVRAKAALTYDRCPIELTPQLIGLEGKRVEVVDKYGEKRRFYVGKSTGFIPVHLEIARIDSLGGGAVSGAPFKSVRVIGKLRRGGRS
jgi:hypothetical protein